MAQYIDKAALVMEIERRMQEHHSGYLVCLKDIRSFIDTLEVKEVNLENSVVCKVDWYDGFILDYTQEQQDELLNKIGANIGDNIRVILIKE